MSNKETSAVNKLKPLLFELNILYLTIYYKLDLYSYCILEK